MILGLWSHFLSRLKILRLLLKLRTCEFSKCARVVLKDRGLHNRNILGNVE